MKKAKIGMKVIDRWYSLKYKNPWGFGKILKITKSSVHIKFSKQKEKTIYDKAHFNRFIAIFNKANLKFDFVKENKKYSLKLN